MVQFLNPLMLIGLGAVALPVVVHLMHRRRSREVWFPSLMFLLKIDARTMRRKRLREVLILAARALLLALLALAAARPVLADRSTSGGNTALVVVLDTSLSMGYREENVTRFRRAQEAALRAVDSLDTGDRAAVLTPTDDEPATLVGDLGLLRHRIRTAEVGHGDETLRAAVERAGELLAAASEQNREVLLLSDLQRRAVGALGGALPEGVRVLVGDLGRDRSPNRTLVDVVPGRRTAVLGQPLALTATVRGEGEGSAAARVSVYVGKERVGQRTVPVAPGASASVIFEVTPDTAGEELTGRIALDADALPGDDVRHFAVPVLDRIGVLAVDGDPSPTAWMGETYFLRAALDPTGLGEVRIQTPFRLTVVPPEELGTRDLGAFRVVILANVGELEGPPARDLAAFVRNGGGLIVFGGSRMTREALARTYGDDAPAAGLLPRLPRGVLVEHVDRGPLPRLGRIDTAHPILRGLDEGFRNDLRRVRCTQALDLAGQEGRDLIEFEDGRAVLVEGDAGAGRVLMFAVTADAAWSNLPKRPLFVALLHRAVYRLLRGGSGTVGRTVGEAIPLPRLATLGPGASVEVYPPDREDDPVRFSDASRGESVFDDTSRPGLYRIAVRAGPRRTESRVPVNVNPAEGRLARFGLPALTASLEGVEVRAVDAGGDLEEELRRARMGRPVWSLLLALAILVLVVEAWLANRWARPPARGATREEPEPIEDEARPRPVAGGTRR
jgi:hypothetical protein